MKTNGQYPSLTSAGSLIAAALLTIFVTIFAGSAFANRPAIQAQENMRSTEPQAAQQAVQTRPTAEEAPSAVEVMMQQQGQQSQYSGDVLQLPAKELQPGETISIQLLDYPRRGMSMEKVQQQYGQPISASESVGQPPISSWTYNDRIVYFEYATVLHVVAR